MTADHSRPGRWSAMAAGLLLTISVAGPAAAADPGADPMPVSLLVVGPDGEPIPGVEVEVRTRPVLAAEQVRRGGFREAGPYGATVTADAEGRLAVDLPGGANRLSMKITAPGYAPYWVDWNPEGSAGDAPVEIRAELDAAWSVGGVVVDAEGRPVAGAKVRPSVKFKKPPGDRSELHVGTSLVTDAEGRWRFDSVPESLGDVHVEVGHPDFMPLRRSLPRNGFGLGTGETPSAPIALDPGLTVTGTVTDDAGTPIADALVRTKFLNDIREARTGPDGVYMLRGCEPRSARIVASAKGRATDLREVVVEPDLPPVDFRLPPGGSVRVRVLDEKGNPVPKARIFFQTWRGRIDYFEFDHVSQYADENGLWRWDEAPVDGFEADICRPDGMQLARRPLAARAEEHVFRVPPALVISGTVTDKATKKPIGSFRVVPGIRSSEEHMNWVENSAVEGKDGRYRVRQTHDYFAHFVRVEANGYAAAVSRDVKSDEGEVAIDFELEPAADVAATVLTPEGGPAAGAKVALGTAGSQINIENGDIDEGSTYATRVDADGEGQFRFPAPGVPFQLVIVHPAGYAHVDSAAGPVPDSVRLTAWARAEGTFRVGSEPAAGVPLTVNTGTLHSYGEKVPSIFTHHEATTSADGRFIFERVVPGDGRIGRRITLMVREGATEVTSAAMVAAAFRAGETTRLDLGGDGRAVTGRLDPPAGVDVRWSHALVRLGPDLPSLTEPEPPAEAAGDPAKRAAWRREWLATDAGRAWLDAARALESLEASGTRFTATVARDGSFRIDDVPPGDYVLSVRLDDRAPGPPAEYRFSVESDESREPVDLGTLGPPEP